MYAMSLLLVFACVQNFYRIIYRHVVRFKRFISAACNNDILLTGWLQPVSTVNYVPSRLPMNTLPVSVYYVISALANVINAVVTPIPSSFLAILEKVTGHNCTASCWTNAEVEDFYEGLCMLSFRLR